MGQPPSAPNPFAASPAAAPPPRSSRVWLWVLLGIVGTGAVVCCGCMGIGWFAMNAGFSGMAQDVKSKLSTDPVAKEHLGEIQSVSADFFASIQESEKRDGEHVFVFHTVGSKGKGDVVGKQPVQGTITIRDPKLVLPDGREFDLSF
jgi:hypothetical protein